MEKKVIPMVLSILIALFLSACGIINEAAPKITEGEFPFVVEYEMNGEIYLIEDTVVCSFDGYDMSNEFSFINTRTWHQYLKSGQEERRLFIEFEPNTESVLTKGRINTESRLILNYGFGGYYLGDPHYKTKKPCINYVETYKASEKASYSMHTEMSEKQLEEYFGIKIIRFQFSKPIKNIFD